MGDNCLVRIVGHRDAEEIKERGRHHVKNGMHYVFFDRKTEGTGEKFTLKFDEKSLRYSRRGLLQSDVELERGKRTCSRYITPYGEFEIGFDTTLYEYSEDDGVILINAGYAMTLNGQEHEPGKIMIEVRRDERMEVSD